MENKEYKKYRVTYPKMRYFMKGMRNSYINYKNMTTSFSKRNQDSKTIPSNYGVCNTNTVDSEFDLTVLDGAIPSDINGNLYITQCLGTKEAFMVGDTNLVKINFNSSKAHLTNKMMWSPVSLAKVALQNTVHKFDHMGLMVMSPGMGMFSYTEGMYLLPDGRLSVTSDVDRPWIIKRSDLQIESPLGTREEWLPMMGGDELDIMGSLFAGYSNSHVIYTDVETNELFLVNYQGMQKDKTHPCILMKWDGSKCIDKWRIVDENNEDILIKQSIHELIFTRDYILLADTAFATGSEILCPWKNSPLPNPKTVVYIVDRRELLDNKEVVAKKIQIDEACIHLIAEYENINDVISVYMLHTPATNTAEIIRNYDKDLNGKRFAENLVGYGTLPPLDLSSIGKHKIDMKTSKVVDSKYLRDEKYSFGPYMYTYMDRQIKNFQDQDLFIMFKGFKSDMLPKRIYKAYKGANNKLVSLEDLTSGKISCDNSIIRLNKEKLTCEDIYMFDNKTLLYTITCLSSTKNKDGYLLAGIVKEVSIKDEGISSGHEYWLFDVNKLSDGPICKLGDISLNNSVLFHTVYLPDNVEKQLDKKKVVYNVDIKKDYSKEELIKWNPEVLRCFENIIYPYFDKDKKDSSKIDIIIENYAKKRINFGIGSEYLIPEEEFDDPKIHAIKMFDETKRMHNTTGWKLESNKNNVIIESKKISGPLAISGVDVTRARAIFNINANKLFDYITSPEGYAVIDPVSNPDDHLKKPLEVYEWKKNSRLELAIATTNIPFLETSDFLVLNAIDNDEMIFASKSIINSLYKGASKYKKDNKYIPNNVRALNTFSIYIKKIDENTCEVKCINYADMAGKTNSFMNNLINKKIFFQGLYERIKTNAEKL